MNEVKPLKVRQEYGFDPSLSNKTINRSLAHCVWKPILKLSCLKHLEPHVSTSQIVREFYILK